MKPAVALLIGVVGSTGWLLPPALASEAAHAADKTAGAETTAVEAAPSPSIAMPNVSDEPGSPVRLIRGLQDSQDLIAAGDASAFAAQARSMRDVSEGLAAAPPETWRTPVQAQALATYLFSGGQPRVVRGVIAAGTVAPEALGLVKGALAYAENRESEAKILLMPLDALELPASLGGQLALIQAGLVLREDRPRALRLLDRARLLAPGTLVEEAALRRAIFITGESLETARFVPLAERYLRRFKTSPYAGNFSGNLVRLLDQVAQTDDGAGLAKVEPLLALLSDAQRGALFLNVARVAVLHGKTELGLAVARRAGALSLPGTPETARARLYEAAGLAVVDPDASSRTLASVDRSQLQARDATLRAAVAEAGRRIKAVPEGPAPEASRSDVLDAVQQALGGVDATLRSGS